MPRPPKESRPDATKKQLINIREVFEESSYLTTLDDLEKRGKKRVKVVRPDQILQLIEQAVDRVVLEAKESSDLEGRSRLVERSEEEFQKLLKEKAQAQASAAAPASNAESEAAIAELREEMNSLRAENATLRRMSNGKGGETAELNKRLEELQGRVHQGESEAEELRVALEQARSQGGSGASPELRARIEELEQAHERSRSAIEAAEEAADRARDRARQAEKDYDEARQALLDREDRLRRFESEVEAARSQGSQVADEAIVELENEMTRHQATREELAQLQGLLTHQQERTEALEAQLVARSHDDTDSEKRVRQLEEALTEAQDAIQTRDDRLHEIDQEMGEIRSSRFEELAGLRSEVEALREAIRREEELRQAAEIRLAEREQELARVVEEFEDYQAKKVEELSELRAERNRLTEEVRGFDGAGQQARDAEHTQLRDAHRDLTSQLETIQRTSESERESLRLEWEARVRELENTVVQLEQERAHVHENVEAVHRDANRRAEELTGELGQKNEALATLRGENSALRERLSQMEETASQLPAPDEIQKLLADQLEAIRGELAKRTVAGGSTGTGRGSAADVKLALDALFTHGDEMESNIESVGVKASKGASILDNLRRMKSLRQKDDTES